MKPFGQGPHVMGEATERAALAAWIAVTESPEWSAAAELRLLLAVDPEVIARRKGELNALLASDELLPTKGYTWTLEAINAHVDGISHGKAVSPMAGAALGGGQHTFFAEWADGDWVAWERHPQRHDLWRWVSSDAETPAQDAREACGACQAIDDGADPWTPHDKRHAEAPPWGPQINATAEALPPALPSDPVGALGSLPGAPAGDLPAPVGSAPTRAELARVQPVACTALASCCLCDRQLMHRELAFELRGWWAHHACGVAETYAPPPAWGATEGARLRSLREARGLSQKALAEKTSVSAGRISEAELGKRGLSQDVLEQVAKAVGVTLDVVLGKAAPLTRLQEQLAQQAPMFEPGSALDEGPPDDEEPAEAYAEDRSTTADW